MSSRTGICTNIAGCTLAYTQQVITVVEGDEYRCPECGQDLQESHGAAGGGGAKLPIGIIAAVVVGVLVIGAGVFYGPKLLSLVSHPPVTPAPDTPVPVTPVPTPTPPPPPTPTPTPPPPTPTPKTTPRTKITPPVTPAETPPVSTPDPNVAVKHPLVPDKTENAEVKKQVLERIELIPNLSPANKEMLTTAVQRARGMYKLSSIYFEFGSVTPSPVAVTQLVESLRAPDVRELLADTSSVIVVLGYADTKGDPERSRVISQRRADGLSKALRVQGGIKNAMHAVGMGSSEMFGKTQRDKNRVVEIWAVLPGEHLFR